MRRGEMFQHFVAIFQCDQCLGIGIEEHQSAKEHTVMEPFRRNCRVTLKW